MNFRIFFFARCLIEVEHVRFVFADARLLSPPTSLSSAFAQFSFVRLPVFALFAFFATFVFFLGWVVLFLSLSRDFRR